jgi:hypothetical protein
MSMRINDFVVLIEIYLLPENKKIYIYINRISSTFCFLVYILWSF